MPVIDEDEESPGAGAGAGQVSEEVVKRDQRIRDSSIHRIMLDELLDRVEQRLKTLDLKPTLTEYVRLVQLRREITEDQPKEVLVTWVEQSKEGDVLKQ
jgi:hypothetical protein